MKYDLNLYDTRVIRCARCDKCLGELDYDTEVIRLLCAQCANPLPYGDDHLSYTINSSNNRRKEKSVELIT